MKQTKNKQKRETKDISKSLLEQYQSLMGDFPVTGQEGVMFKKFSLYNDAQFETHTYSNLDLKNN